MKQKIYYLTSSSFVDNQMNILKYLAAKYEITYAVVIPRSNSNYTKKEIEEYCNYYKINFTHFDLNHRLRDPRLVTVYISIIKQIIQSKSDAIYIANFDQIYLNILLLLFIDSSKTIISFHDVESHSKSPFEFMAALSKKMLIFKFKLFHTYSKIQADILKYLAPTKSIYNISLPLIDFGTLKKSFKSPDIIQFLFFGNILHYKGLDLLISAFCNVSKKYSNARLIIAGRCDDWELYAPLALGSSQIISDIRFIRNDEIATYFSSADYLVLPYRDTTQSGPLMIAFNYTIPVLVSDAIGFKEFTEDEVTGYSFKLAVVGDLERVLEVCITKPKDSYNELKQRLFKFTNVNFSINEILAKYDKMFNDAFLSSKNS